ncbi:MAG: T9SS type A sorting domain-containing protein, partial [Bacteroidetes bacterium]|nr:T9SS type A sorting domain-containing protein [Bacteroidota bacterium]
PDGTVKARRTISSATAPFVDTLEEKDRFGGAVASLGDLDGDGVPDFAIGAPGDDDGCLGITPNCDKGALWVVPGTAFLTARVKAFAVTPEAPVLGEDIRVSAQITDPNGITRATLSFRAAGTPSFSTTLMNPVADGAFSATIPPLLSPQGIEYFVTATNALGVSTRAPASGIRSVPVYVPDGLETPLPSGQAASAYRLISIPLDLDEKSARSVFEDDLGPYDKKTWRFFLHQIDFSFLELDRADIEMTPGQAFWLLVQEPGRELTTGPGTSVRTEVSFSIPLRAQWNLISNPFNFPIPVTKVRTASGQALEIWGYDGSWSPLDSLLMPFAGYAVFNGTANPDTLLVDPDLSTESQGAFARRAERNRPLDWSIRILARQGQARDTDNVAAASSAASAGWDALDRPEPPAIGDYVRVSFPHASWKRAAAHYSTDARPVAEEGAVWPFEVQTHRSGQVDLRFEGIEAVPSEYTVWLVDELVGLRQDLRVQPRYAVVTGGAGQARHLTLLVGPAPMLGQEVTEEVPSRYKLFQNFPNPFRSATTIRYGVPEASRVRMVVYDVLGRRVATLVEGEATAGYHAVVWDGRSDAEVPVGSGLYLVRMQSGRFAQTRTMLVVR